MAPPASTSAARQRFIKRPGDTCFRAVGCSYCGDSGYRGRVGIFEVLPVDSEITALIRKDADPQKIQTVAVQAGMTTMLEDGLSKYRRGVTSIEEVLRVTKHLVVPATPALLEGDGAAVDNREVPVLKFLAVLEAMNLATCGILQKGLLTVCCRYDADELELWRGVRHDLNVRGCNRRWRVH
eukprot:gene48779-59726_t